MRQFNDKLLRLLIDGGVDFVIVGGIAAIAHGALRTTLDQLIAIKEHLGRAKDLEALRELRAIRERLRG